MTGFFRDKPVLLISVAMVIFLLVILVMLISLTEFSVLKALRKLYKDSIIPKMKTHNQEEWRYCMDTSEIFTPQLNKLMQLT